MGLASRGVTTPGAGDAVAPATGAEGCVLQAQQAISAITADATALRRFITAVTPEGLPAFRPDLAGDQPTFCSNTRLRSAGSWAPAAGQKDVGISALLPPNRSSPH
jgi:hypothetical protein